MAQNNRRSPNTVKVQDNRERKASPRPPSLSEEKLASGPRGGLPLMYLPVVILCGAGILGAVFWIVKQRISTTKIENFDEEPSLLPSNWAELKATSHYIREVSRQHPFAIGCLFVVAYLFKQTFSFPGSAILNAFAGIAFGGVWGVLLAIACTALGTMGAYTLSKVFGTGLLAKFHGEGKLAWLQNQIEKAKANKTAFFYLIALRVAPIFPQWLLNIGAPHIGINESLFVATTTLGLTPYNTISVRAGAFITELEWEDIFTWTTLATLLGLAILFLLPAFILKRMEAARPPIP